MTYVTHTGQVSDDLWKFDTSKRVWVVVDTGDTMVNGDASVGRIYHVMTSVGLDLWLHGGKRKGEGEGDTSSTSTVLLLLY
jgi:hypothetical protein